MSAARRLSGRPLCGEATWSLDIEEWEGRVREGWRGTAESIVGLAQNTRLLGPGAPLLRRPVAQPARELGC